MTTIIANVCESDSKVFAFKYYTIMWNTLYFFIFIKGKTIYILINYTLVDENSEVIQNISYLHVLIFYLIVIYQPASYLTSPCDRKWDFHQNLPLTDMVLYNESTY